MLENASGQTCESCNSQIITYEKEGNIIFECGYCGLLEDEPQISMSCVDEYRL